MPSNKQFKAEHGDVFNAESITIMHGEGAIVLDFKQSSPRFDQVEGDTQHTLITEHDTIKLDPQTAKMLHELLEENIENYEEKFGEIETPDRDEDEDEVPEEGHGYIG